MWKDDLKEALTELLREPVSAHDLVFYEVEIAGAQSAPIVRIFIDLAEGGITLDEVTEATRWLSDLLDQADPIESSYTLEVSSPGIDRSRGEGQKNNNQIASGKDSK